MKPLILICCYYDESHNFLDAMEVFPHDNLIIIKKLYDFNHVLTNQMLPLMVYHTHCWTIFPQCICQNGPTFILTNYGRNA